MRDRARAIIAGILGVIVLLYSHGTSPKYSV
jgi:hypothetical protein